MSIGTGRSIPLWVAPFPVFGDGVEGGALSYTEKERLGAGRQAAWSVHFSLLPIAGALCPTVSGSHHCDLSATVDCNLEA